MGKRDTFRRELTAVINKHSKENGSDTPDFILADYLINCLNTFDKALDMRSDWYGIKLAEKKICTDDKLQKIADDINYHNDCARATLGDLPKVTVEDLKKVELPLATRPAIRPFTQEELDGISAWLQSDEGKQKMKEGQENAEKFCDELNKNNQIDPKILREPFNI